MARGKSTLTDEVVIVSLKGVDIAAKVSSCGDGVSVVIHMFVKGTIIRVREDGLDEGGFGVREGDEYRGSSSRARQQLGANWKNPVRCYIVAHSGDGGILREASVDNLVRFWFVTSQRAVVSDHPVFPWDPSQSFVQRVLVLFDVSGGLCLFQLSFFFLLFL